MRFPLRIKLALVSLLLLIIPLAGLRFSDLIKQDLTASQEQTLLFSARAVASALAGREGLFDRELFNSSSPEKDLYLHQLETPIRLNGKFDDWQPLLKEAEDFGAEHLLFAAEPYQPDSFHLTHITGTRTKYLYALFIVTDDSIIYRNRNSLRLDRSDHLRIVTQNEKSETYQYLLTPKKPGWVNGFLLINSDPSSFLSKPEPRIQGMWLEHENGYVLELRLPLAMVGKKLGFTVTDIDDPVSRQSKYVVGTTTSGTSVDSGWLLSSSDAIDRILAALGNPHARITIIDTNRRIRASHGDLNITKAADKNFTDINLLSRINAFIHYLFSPLYNLAIQSNEPFYQELPENLTTLELPGVKEALQGTSTVKRFSLKHQELERMAAMVPLTDDGQVIGAVVIEQTTDSILKLQNRVVEESLTLTILIFGFAGMGLIFFAFNLSSRIRSLTLATSRAINSAGKIEVALPDQAAKDELGDLARSLASMLSQLKIQNSFREKMADNLEHEMRTPLAGISASMKNLAGELEQAPPRIKSYLDWALKDVTRLENLLTSIRDATSLQSLISGDQKEQFNLTSAIQMWLNHSWKSAFKGVEFQFDFQEPNLLFRGDPSRIHQMLDKLVENAVSFHTPSTPIVITLRKQNHKIKIDVINEGPAIAKELQPQIFNSMVSHRDRKEPRPHLGLGLFIVRTIVEQYQGTASVICEGNNSHNLTTFTIMIKSVD